MNQDDVPTKENTILPVINNEKIYPNSNLSVYISQLGIACTIGVYSIIFADVSKSLYKRKSLFDNNMNYDIGNKAIGYVKISIFTQVSAVILLFGASRICDISKRMKE